MNSIPNRYPVGHFVRALGPLGDKDTENEVLLLEHDVPHSKFSEEVLSFLPKLPWTITEEVSTAAKSYLISNHPPRLRLHRFRCSTR